MIFIDRRKSLKIKTIIMLNCLSCHSYGYKKVLRVLNIDICKGMPVSQRKGSWLGPAQQTRIARDSKYTANRGL